MPLPSNLVSEFVEVTAEHVDVKSEESTVYGTIVVQNDVKYVQLDGSDILTPIDSTTESLDGDRVIVLIKNHSATVTGNLSNNSASVGTTNQIATDLDNTNTLLVETINATNGRFDNLSATYATIGLLEANYATIENLSANYATIENLNATNAKIENLDTEYLNANFANITEASIEEFFSKLGMIENVTIGDATVTGALVSTTIKGDLIEAGTLKADKLIIRGDDGLYYQLNIDENGVVPEGVSEDDLRNGLHGSHIIAQSITADKMSVTDLEAFKANIGGFKIDTDAIRSVGKPNATATTQGIYMNKDGEFAVGDGTNYLKYYKDTDDNYKLAISAASMILGGSGKNVEETLDEIANGSLAGVEVGGRNYIPGTQSMELWATSSAASITLGNDGISILDFGTPASKDYSLCTIFRPYINFSSIRGKTMTFSMMVRSDAWAGNSGDLVYVSFKLYSSASEERWYKTVSFSDVTSEWTKYTLTMTMDDSYFSSGVSSNPDFVIDDTTLFSIKITNYSTSHLQIKQLQLENGNVTTDWSPAPEDTNIDVGGRNLLRYTDVTKSYADWVKWTGDSMEVTDDGYLKITPKISTDTTTVQGGAYPRHNANIVSGEVYTLSFEAYADSDMTLNYCRLMKSPSGSTAVGSPFPITTTSARYSCSFIAPAVTNPVTILIAYRDTTGNGSATPFYIRNLKLERGHKATDWTIAPEDTDEALDEAVSAVQDSVDENTQRISNAQLAIDTINSVISTLVTGENGESLMTQTDTGWTFSLAGIQSALNTATANLDNVSSDLDTVSTAIDGLNDSVGNLNKYTEYIDIGTDEGKPCIVLGELDSDFKVKITNTDIRFMEGNTIPASISNQSMNISKAVISEELTQGSFSWIARPNGNYGLLWKG